MKQRFFSLLLFFLTFVLSGIQDCQYDVLSNFDYPEKPYQPYDFRHLNLELTLDPEKALVGGVAEYKLAPKVDGLTHVLLHTAESAIESVLLDDEEADYYVSGDSLLVTLPDSSRAGKEFSLQISWQSTSKFGLSRDFRGNFWSSKNPTAHHHWFPVFDHPRVELTVDAYFTIPNETEVLFNGDLVAVKPFSQNLKRVHYQTTKEVPVTGLGFALGDFVISEMTAGFTKIRLFAPEFDFPDTEREQLVVEAAKVKRAVENQLSFEYPWDGLNIVVLPDNTWEERTHGTGTVFLYQNLGSLSNQLKRGIYLQWFGEYLRSEQYFMFEDYDQILAIMLHKALEDSSLIIANPDSTYKLQYWNEIQQEISFPEDYMLMFEHSLSEFLKTMKGVVNPYQYEEYWYQQTGIPLDEFPTLNYDLTEPESEPEPEQTIYKVDAYYNETGSELELVFSLVKGRGEELSELTLVEHQFDAVQTHEVIFTGQTDTVRVTLDSSVEFITFQDQSFLTDNLQYGHFPLYFLLNQLRSSEPEDRILAASLINNYRENPDIQLALTDVLAFEEHPEVIAAINASLADITAGATGTEEKFLEGLRSNSREVQLASLEALVNYPGNERVKAAVRSLLFTNDGDLFSQSLKVYNQIATLPDMLSVIQRLQRSDSTGNRILQVLSSSDSLHYTPEALEIATRYTENTFPYQTRKEALRYLKKYNSGSEWWNNNLEVLVTDRDPRIRYWAVGMIPEVTTTSQVLDDLTTLQLEEADPRVLARIEEIIERLEK